MTKNTLKLYARNYTNQNPGYIPPISEKHSSSFCYFSSNCSGNTPVKVFPGNILQTVMIFTIFQFTIMGTFFKYFKSHSNAFCFNHHPTKHAGLWTISNTGIFLRNLQNFDEHLLTAASDCCKKSVPVKVIKKLSKLTCK